MPRLFTAIKIPAMLANQLSLWGGGLNGARWIDWQNMHITLCYLGDVEQARIPSLIRVLEKDRSEPLIIKLDHLDVFGSKKPRALYVGVKSNDALNKLQSGQATRLRYAGFDLEKRRFVPHVTLARLSNVRAGVLARYLQMRGRIEPVEFETEETVLLSSGRSRGGGPYFEEAVFDLTGVSQRQVDEAHHPMPV